MAEACHARIHLCGRLTISLDGRRVEQDLPGRQGRLLLAYLVLNRARTASRGELVGALWDQGVPDRVDAALSALLSKLRRIFGADWLEGRSAVRLALPADAWVDVEAAADGLHRAEAAAARSAHDEVWGPARVAQHITMRFFLPGEEGEWIDAVRRRLEDIRLRSLELVAQSSLELSAAELPTAERAARSLVDEAPYRETGYRLLMEVLAARGDVAEATLVYERLRTRLRDDLGLTPGQETRSLYEQLLRGAG